MPRIVTDPCVNCKYADCVEVCPVNCFFEIDDMLVIHPDECIDCEACDPECPVSAIKTESTADSFWIKKNAEIEWDESKRRFKKEEVTPGPNQKENP